jgi:thymidylate synthase (FAD)
MHEIPLDLHETKFGRQFNDRDNFYHWEDRHFENDTLAHFAGRSCYQSWHMPNPETSTDEGYIANIIKQGHFSVLEHGSATFYITGVSRNLTHELIRHRHLSYSELSQRFVDMDDSRVVVAPANREQLGLPDRLPQLPQTLIDYNVVVDRLMSFGKTRKQAREAARYDLPGGTETKIVVTGNHRAWRDMLHKRYSVHADAEIREFAALVLSELRLIAPASYQDFPEEPFE